VGYPNTPGIHGLLREIYGGAYIANGGFDRERALRAIEAGEADLIAFGRPFLANPDLPERLALEVPLNTPDPATFSLLPGYAGYSL
jgi:N-ethylmaleimide reductase